MEKWSVEKGELVIGMTNTPILQYSKKLIS
jgi:hypothetical protein